MKDHRRIRTWAMAGMLAAAALPALCCDKVLETRTVFAHLFYIPIVLSALWWGRRGIPTALLLGALLPAGQWIDTQDPIDFDDLVRACMFVLVSWAVALWRDRIVGSQAALKRQSAESQQRLLALSCLQGISRLRDESSEMDLDDLFRGTLKLLCRTGLNGHDASVRIGFQGRSFASDRPGASSFRVASQIKVNGAAAGELEVFFPPAPVPDSFAYQNARELIDAAAGLLGKIIEHAKDRTELNRYHLHLEELVHRRTEELILINRRLREEIAERVKVKESLGESENKYRLLFENASEAIFIAQNGRIRFSNAALSKLTGFSTDQMLKMSFEELIHPGDRKLVSERHRQRSAGMTIPSSYAFRLWTAEETPRWVEINSVLFQWQDQPATLNYLRDITVRQRLETSIGHTQKMEAIGALAGGIAHKFNNALAGITGHTEILKYSLPDNPLVERYSEAVFQSVQDMAGLVKQLLAYARGGKYQPRVQSLLPLAREVVQWIPVQGEKKIAIETALSADTPQVEIDAVQVRMVLLAVINNAVEAVDKGGRIHIETFPARLGEKEAEAFTGLPPGSYSALSIADNGGGMSEEVSARIFEPFFSTKFIGRGLGMAAAYGIVKNHGGFIYVDSEPGRGTAVHILLPAIRPEPKQ